MDLPGIATALWAAVSPYLLTAKPIVTAEVPGLLSGMGVVNTVSVFAYSTVLGRVAGVKYRRDAVIAFVFAWVAVVLVVLGYVLNSAFAWQTGVLVDAGLIVWIGSFASALFFIYLGAKDVVGRGNTAAERFPAFTDRSASSRFGVAFIDQVLMRAARARGHVNYPFLLIHDIDSPGVRLAAAFVRAGLRAGEGVIYLSFSRPHTTIARQLAAGGLTEAERGALWIVDCYSAVYMPEARKNRQANTVHADPRDPTDVYRKYMQALAACRRATDSVRVVYETLSDFIKIADADLVINYLRRVIVLEEDRHVRAIYLYWKDSGGGQVDAAYLRWFFSATLEIVMPKPMTQPAELLATFARFFPDPVGVRVGPDLRLDEAALFQANPARIGLLGQSMRRLAYKAQPYGFLPAIQGADRPRQLCNFLFFMAAIDHDTHPAGGRFEDVLDGRALHGSDLLYALAQRAKQADPALFLPDRFAGIADDDVAAIFTTPSGRQPTDLPGRAEIFRTAAQLLIADFGGDAASLVRQARNRLGGANGLLASLARFPAFRDPFGKKTALFVKLLVREGLFAPVDPALIDVAIDHVVMTMALRSGVVRTADAGVRAAVGAGQPLDHLQTELLRETTRVAMRGLAQAAGLRSDEIDDLIWAYGRISLRGPTPLQAPYDVHTDLDGQVDGTELPRFVAILNGLDTVSDDVWPAAATVRGPFTRFY